ALIRWRHSLNSHTLPAGMSNHIRVREVDDHYIVFFRFDRLHKFITYLGSAHLRLKVVCGNLGRFHKDPVLALIGFLNAAVEKESNMGVFLRLCNTDLSHIVSRQILAESIVKQYFVECNQLVGDRLVIICEAYISKVQTFFALKSFEIIIAERSRDLTGAIRTEIEEYDRLSLLYNSHKFAVLLDHCGEHAL